MTRLNDYDQPIGDPVSDWSPRPVPPHATIEGRFCRLEAINAKRHGADLFAANATAPDGRAWTYLFAEPLTRCEDFCAYLEKIETSRDPLFFAVVDNKTQRAVGFLSLMRIDSVHGVIEAGNINYSPLMQRTPAGTEAQYLLMKLAFDTLGYRRFEWKCDSLNAPSRNAALRYGFTFEGIFRQAVIYKGRSRDTAWFSIIDSEWLTIKAAMETWLSSDNFEPDGSQRMSLVDIRQRLPSKVNALLPAARQQANTLQTTHMKIRLAGTKDYPQWLPLWEGYQAFYKTSIAEQVTQKTWTRFLDPAEPMHCAVAEQDGVLVGMVHYILHRSCWTEGDYIYLQDLYAVPDLRGKGIGRALIEHVYAAAKAQGCSRVHWLTHESNTDAMKLYDNIADRSGFIQYRKLMA